MSIEQRITELMAQMTLAEKVSLCHAGSKFAVAAIPRLGIPEFWMSDGPHGVRHEICRDSWDPVDTEEDRSTYLPTGIAWPRPGILRPLIGSERFLARRLGSVARTSSWDPASTLPGRRFADAISSTLARIRI